MGASLQFDLDHGFDLTVEDGKIASDTDLETAVIVSLFTDAAATDSELLDAGLTRDDRRGSWQDTYPDVEGDVMGSKLWLLARAKRTDETLRAAETYARAALAWLLVDKVAIAVNVSAAWYRSTAFIALTVEIVRPRKVDPRWRRVWNAITGEALDEAA